jgi:hypothetical protein
LRARKSYVYVPYASRTSQAGTADQQKRAVTRGGGTRAVDVEGAVR